jgi:hypothetical protein
MHRKTALLFGHATTLLCAYEAGPLEGGMAGDCAHARPADTAFQVR